MKEKIIDYIVSYFSRTQFFKDIKTRDDYKLYVLCMQRRILYSWCLIRFEKYYENITSKFKEEYKTQLNQLEENLFNTLTHILNYKFPSNYDKLYSTRHSLIIEPELDIEYIKKEILRGFYNTFEDKLNENDFIVYRKALNEDTLNLLAKEYLNEIEYICKIISNKHTASYNIKSYINNIRI